MHAGQYYRAVLQGCVHAGLYYMAVPRVVVIERLHVYRACVPCMPT